MKLRKLWCLLALAASSTVALADIAPDDGKNFGPYAFTAGLMDTLAVQCTQDSSQQTITSASSKLQVTLERFGMPAAAYQEEYARGKAQVDAALSEKSPQQVCTEKVIETLDGWTVAVNTVVTHLEDEDAKPSK